MLHTSAMGCRLSSTAATGSRGSSPSTSRILCKSTREEVVMVKIKTKLAQIADKLTAAAPLIDGTAEGRALAQKSIREAAAELKQIIEEAAT